MAVVSGPAAPSQLLLDRKVRYEHFSFAKQKTNSPLLVQEIGFSRYFPLRLHLVSYRNLEIILSITLLFSSNLTIG